MTEPFYNTNVETMHRLNLRGAEAQVYSALLFLCSKGPYKGSYQDIAYFSCCGVDDTASNIIKKLINKGLVVRDEQGIRIPNISGINPKVSGENPNISGFSKEKRTKKENIIKENKGGDIAPPPPEYFEVLSFGKKKNIPEKVCLGFFSHFTEFHWKHKEGDPVTDWKATLVRWYLREKNPTKPDYSNPYSRATEQEQASFVGSQYAEYLARKEREKQEEAARQANEETRFVSYEEYKKQTTL